MHDPQTGLPPDESIGSAGFRDLTVAEEWANFIESTHFRDLPVHVVEIVKARILDCISTAIESSHLTVPKVALKFIGSQTGCATVFGKQSTFPPIDAAFVNATFINGSTHDDFLYKSHAGAVVIPAALAVAEEQRSSVEDLIVSIALGYEIVARTYLGGPMMLPKFRATGVAGAIGAAAAAGKLYKLDRTELISALGCAAMFASGFGEGFKTGTMDVKLNVGWASRTGVSAARLAACGASATETAFEGESGFYLAHANSLSSVSGSTEGLGNRFLIEDTVYKELPICIFVQTPVYLALQLMKKEKLNPMKIESVSIRAPQETLTNPGYKNTAPFASPLKARISARFTTAAALLGKPVETYEFYDDTENAQVLALAKKIQLLEPLPDQGGRVDLQVTCGGNIFEISGEEMETLFPTMEKVSAKFRNLVRRYPEDWSESVLDKVLHLEQLTNISDLSIHLREFGSFQKGDDVEPNY